MFQDLALSTKTKNRTCKFVNGIFSWCQHYEWGDIIIDVIMMFDQMETNWGLATIFIQEGAVGDRIITVVDSGAAWTKKFRCQL